MFIIIYGEMEVGMVQAMLVEAGEVDKAVEAPRVGLAALG